MNTALDNRQRRSAENMRDRSDKAGTSMFFKRFLMLALFCLLNAIGSAAQAQTTPATSGAFFPTVQWWQCGPGIAYYFCVTQQSAGTTAPLGAVSCSVPVAAGGTVLGWCLGQANPQSACPGSTLGADMTPWANFYMTIADNGTPPEVAGGPVTISADSNINILQDPAFTAVGSNPPPGAGVLPWGSQSGGTTGIFKITGNNTSPPFTVGEPVTYTGTVLSGAQTITFSLSETCNQPDQLDGKWSSSDGLQGGPVDLTATQ